MSEQVVVEQGELELLFELAIAAIDVAEYHRSGKVPVRVLDCLARKVAALAAWRTGREGQP